MKNKIFVYVEVKREVQTDIETYHSFYYRADEGTAVITVTTEGALGTEKHSARLTVNVDSKYKVIAAAKAKGNCTYRINPKKTYYVKVRTYKKVGAGTYYSAWSKVKKIKTK